MQHRLLFLFTNKAVKQLGSLSGEEKKTTDLLEIPDPRRRAYRNYCIERSIYHHRTPSSLEVLQLNRGYEPAFPLSFTVWLTLTRCYFTSDSLHHWGSPGEWLFRGLRKLRSLMISFISINDTSLAKKQISSIYIPSPFWDGRAMDVLNKQAVYPRKYQHSTC